MTSSELEPSRAASSEALGLIGKVLSERYRIEALLGEGGMGVVYLAEHVLMRKRFAVKVLHAEMTRMPEMVARFEREALAAAHIEHPNVAAATDFGKLDSGAFFLVLEYVEGTNLRDLIEKGPLATRRALHIAHQMASALARATALGIVHRDLKPENVMLVVRDGDPDFVKVLDFGIAKVPVGDLSHRGPNNEGQVLTQLGMVYGTPEYMAPEQALGQEVDARADLYALGVILFEMLTGVRPFEAETKIALLGMKVTSDPPTMASKNPSVRVSQSVEAAVRRLLTKEAKNRFQDAREVLDALETCTFGEADGEPPLGQSNATLPGRVTSLRQATSPRAGMSPFGQSAVAAETLAAESREMNTPPGGGRAGRALANAVAKIHEVSSHLPRVVIRAGGGFLLLLVFIAGVSFMRGAPQAVGTTSEPATNDPARAPPKPAPALAPADALAKAEAAGSAALNEVTTRFPEDQAVWRALVRACTSEKRGVDAMRAVAKLVAVSDRAIEDEDVEAAVKAAVQGPTESADAAFALMESGLGAKGPDLLYDLSTTKGLPSRVQARVKQTLVKPDVKARMSPALDLVVDFRAASSCEAKKALLGRVKEQGDGRLLSSLRALQLAKGCGFLGLADCWSCMRRDNALGASLAAIEERSGK